MDNVAKLMNELELTLNTPGYKRVISPTLQAEMLETYDKLGSLLTKPPEGFTRGEHNIFLSGKIEGLKYAQSVFKTQLAEYRARVAQEAQEQVAEPASGSPYTVDNPPTEG